MSNNGSAEIVNMEAARARRRASELRAEDFESIGAYLRAAREACGLSLEELSARTHIKTAFLDAIEEMAVRRLPSRPFAIGFVKVYAETLELDPGPVVARFKEEAGYAGPIDPAAEAIERPRRAEVAPERPQMSLIAVFLVILFILWCAWQITRPRPATTPFNMQGAASEAVRPADAADDPIVPAAPAAFEARLVERVEPVYPRRCEAAAADVESVEVAFNVTARGAVTGARVARSSNSCFNAAALNAARRWRFEPRNVDGAPRPAYDLRYVFRFERPL
ncbi:TonB family protein [Amphiplicatus metriothermophilus]|uniref:TonB family protein n=1 Tax=Amphiplicatus metriothermophilus TaxID=1519374 RepID=UPI00117874A5|nr:TonB family protein [Amphiplicatus metriothermophilus]MBB5519144.1 TonB family protein [Amphiplicatus metriothermophilus]